MAKGNGLYQLSSRYCFGAWFSSLAAVYEIRQWLGAVKGVHQPHSPGVMDRDTNWVLVKNRFGSYQQTVNGSILSWLPAVGSEAWRNASLAPLSNLWVNPVVVLMSMIIEGLRQPAMMSTL